MPRNAATPRIPPKKALARSMRVLLEIAENPAAPFHARTSAAVTVMQCTTGALNEKARQAHQAQLEEEARQREEEANEEGGTLRDALNRALAKPMNHRTGEENALIHANRMRINIDDAQNGSD